MKSDAMATVCEKFYPLSVNYITVFFEMALHLPGTKD